MGKLNIIPCEIEGLYIIEPYVFRDERGYFYETYSEKDFFDNGLTMKFVQDNESHSTKGVLRGMHFQKTHPQGKLVRALSGTVYDVVVDMRVGSATFGKWAGVELSAENKRQLYIPEGFAHGYFVLSDEATFAYKCTDFYCPGDDGGIPYNDPDVGIVWPGVNDGTQTGTPVNIIDRDANWPKLKEWHGFENGEFIK